jgi:hypothetical protein
LAVLAAPAVERTAETRLGVVFFLARDATADTGHGLSPGFGDRFAAVLTIRSPNPVGERLPRVFDRVGDALIDLILYRAIARPTTCHHKVSGSRIAS